MAQIPDNGPWHGFPNVGAQPNAGDYNFQPGHIVPYTPLTVPAGASTNISTNTPPHNAVEVIKELPEIAPDIYLKILEEDEGGRQIFHMCEGLSEAEKNAYSNMLNWSGATAGEFKATSYDPDKDGKWIYTGYVCNQCDVSIPDEFINKTDFLSKVRKFT